MSVYTSEKNDGAHNAWSAFLPDFSVWTINYTLLRTFMLGHVDFKSLGSFVSSLK